MKISYKIIDIAKQHSRYKFLEGVAVLVEAIAKYKNKTYRILEFTDQISSADSRIEGELKKELQNLIIKKIDGTYNEANSVEVDKLYTNSIK